MKKTLERRIDALEEAASPRTDRFCAVFGDDPDPEPQRNERITVIHLDEEDRHL